MLRGMLRKPFHGLRIKQEIQKLTAIRAPSPNLNPVGESPGSLTRPTPLTSLSPLPHLLSSSQNLPPTSHFRFAHQTPCIKQVSRNITLESLERNPKVVLNKREVYPGDRYEEIMKYCGKVMPLSEQVANKPEVYLGRGFRVAYEEAMKYGAGFMMRHFPLQVALCDKSPLSTKIALISASVLFERCDAVEGPWKKTGCSV